jgi:ribosome-associated protein
MIRLGQLLKLAAVIDSGAEVKTFLQAEPVWVNGEREARRGRQLHPGDVVRVGERELRLISTVPGDPRRPAPRLPIDQTGGSKRC